MVAINRSRLFIVSNTFVKNKSLLLKDIELYHQIFLDLIKTTESFAIKKAISIPWA